MNEQSKKEKRIGFITKAIKIIAFCLVPLIVLQWNLKLVWLKLDFEPFGGVLGVFTPNQQVFMCMRLYMLAWLYFVAYFLVLKKVLLGYILMWILYVVLCFAYLILVGSNPEWLFMQLSLDLWINILLVTMGVINKEIDLAYLLKRSS